MMRHAVLLLIFAGLATVAIAASADLLSRAVAGMLGLDEHNRGAVRLTVGIVAGLVAGVFSRPMIQLVVEDVRRVIERGR